MFGIFKNVLLGQKYVLLSVGLFIFFLVDKNIFTFSRTRIGELKLLWLTNVIVLFYENNLYAWANAWVLTDVYTSVNISLDEQGKHWFFDSVNCLDFTSKRAYWGDIEMHSVTFQRDMKCQSQNIKVKLIFIIYCYNQIDVFILIFIVTTFRSCTCLTSSGVINRNLSI